MRLPPSVSAVVAAGLALAGCDSAGDEAASFGDPYTVLVTADSPRVTDDDRPRLAVAVEYSGGCEEHAFVLRSRVAGDAAEVWWVHDARGDTCEAIQTATVRAALPGTVLEADEVFLLAPDGGALALTVPDL